MIGRQSKPSKSLLPVKQKLSMLPVPALQRKTVPGPPDNCLIRQPAQTITSGSSKMATSEAPRIAQPRGPHQVATGKLEMRPAPPVYRPVLQAKIQRYSTTPGKPAIVQSRINVFKSQGVETRPAPPVYRPLPPDRGQAVSPLTHHAGRMGSRSAVVSGNPPKLRKTGLGSSSYPPAYRPAAARPKAAAISTFSQALNNPGMHGAHGTACGCQSRKCSCHPSRESLIQGRSHPFGRAIIQRTKKKDGIEYAEGEAEATRLCNEHVGDQVVPASVLSSAISIAQNKEFGLEQAYRTIDSYFIELRSAANVQSRRTAATAIEQDLQGILNDALAQNILAAAKDRYINNPAQPNLSVGGTYSQAQVDTAGGEWETLNGANDDFSAWGFRCQDKAAAGRGNVGGTLATRERQANFLCSWNGTTINVHVDLRDRNCPANVIDGTKPKFRDL